MLQRQALGSGAGSIQGGLANSAQQAPMQTSAYVHAEIETINELCLALEGQATELNLRLSCVSEPEGASTAKNADIQPAPNRITDRLQVISMRLRRVLQANHDLMDRLHV